MHKILYLVLVILLNSCNTVSTVQEKPTTKSTITDAPFMWENANVYFLLTDRFNNGDLTNDNSLGRTAETAVLRGFEGGDIKGVIKKLEDGYFNDLGVTAIWLTPIVEQVHGSTNEGTGNTYAYHGYWTKDWTTLDPNFGTEGDLKQMVELAHQKGIKILLDAVVNHTGPVTQRDPAYPDTWVRHTPECTYKSYTTTIDCVLVKNLPDVYTEKNEDVTLPDMLVKKWKEEGRYEEEMASLDEFFVKTGYPRAPKYYIMKWLADYITQYGIDGYRVDTVKHTNEDVWSDFAQICQSSYDAYNVAHGLPKKPFFLVGEVYGYGIDQGKWYNFPDKKVNYFDKGFPALINFDFKYHAEDDYETLFSKYSNILNGSLDDVTVMNYMSSHDDGTPFDKARTKTYESANKLLLAPGISQVYYGDESARSLIINGTVGDATLRSNMNWDEISTDQEVKNLMLHYQKLGVFRKNHPSIGAGHHQMISQTPYWFSRTYHKKGIDDYVVIGLDQPKGMKQVNVEWPDSTKVRDAYSGKITTVTNHQVQIDTKYDVVLLEVY